MDNVSADWFYYQPVSLLNITCPLYYSEAVKITRYDCTNVSFPHAKEAGSPQTDTE